MSPGQDRPTQPVRRTLRSDVLSDHQALQASREKYDPRFADGSPTSTGSLAKDLLTHVGFQQLAVFRLAQAMERAGVTPAAMVLSRLIRHLYGAEMHWQADVAPGVVLVHGVGLVVSRAASVDQGCVLSQGVTLGISSGTDGTIGAPRLGRDVHVAAGAVLVGPIEVGPRCKIGPNVVVSESVPPETIVLASPAQQTRRTSRDPSA